MTFEQIMKLIDAGFTKEEIMGFSSQNTANTAQSAVQSAAQTAQNTANTAQSAAQTAQNTANTAQSAADDMSSVLAAIKATNENIAKLALMQGVQNIPAKETADDILPQFIRV